MQDYLAGRLARVDPVANGAVGGSETLAIEPQAGRPAVDADADRNAGGAPNDGRAESARDFARSADPTDRRRVLVGVAPGAARIAEMYDAIAADANGLAERSDEREVAAIAAYLRGMCEIGVRHVGRLASPPRRRRAG